MTAILDTIFMLALLAAIPAYIMYFISLHDFGKLLQQVHPDIYLRFSAGSHLASSYSALRALRSDETLFAQIDSAVAIQLRHAYRYLIIGLSCFMILLFAGLGDALASKA